MIKNILPHLPFLERVNCFRSLLDKDKAACQQPAVQVSTCAALCHKLPSIRLISSSKLNASGTISLEL